MTVTIDDFKDESAWLGAFPPDQRIEWTQLSLNRKARGGSVSDLAGFNIPSKHNPEGSRWNSGDATTEAWYPQGITGTANAYNPTNRRFIVVSWYGKDEKQYAQKGARLSFIDYSRASDTYPRYRHVLLVQNVTNTHDPNLFRLTAAQRDLYEQLEVFAPVPIHAGGIAWYGNRLYVVDTKLGTRVFDPSQIYPASADRGKSRCGVDSQGHLFAFDYLYVLPQIGYYRTCGTDPNSFISVGNRNSEPCLWMGQYVREGETPDPPRLFGWLFNSEDGAIDTSIQPEIFAPAENGHLPVYGMQGAYRSQGNTWLSVTGRSTYKGSTARLITQSSSATHGDRWRWPHGAEDLYLETTTQTLWCLTEYLSGSHRLPSERVVFGVYFPSYAPELR